MAKLKGAAKAAFLARMAKGRKKAAKANPKKKAAKSKPAKKKSVTTQTRGKSQKKNSGKLKGAAKAAFLARMAKGRSVTSRSRRSAGQSHKKAKKNSRRSRRNEGESIEAASALYEKFHGKPPSSISELDYETRYREHFAELGKLIELRIWLDAANPNFAFTGFGSCKVVSTTDGENIYLIGGDQSIDLSALNISSSKDYVELGPCHYISYFTKKGFHDFEPTTYWHEFGEEDGIFPGLVYDRLNQRLFLTSGNYRVRPEGIVN